MDTNRTNNDTVNAYKLLDVKGKYVEHRQITHIEGRCCMIDGPCCTEAVNNCELNRTIQIMETPGRESDGRGLNLVKSNHGWSGLARMSWNCLFTLTLCIVTMLVMNQPVAAERPFHHRDMRDEAILNPTSSHVSVDNLQAATKYLIQYGYLACNAPEGASTRVQERSRSRTKRQINFRSFPVVPEGRDPAPATPHCTHTTAQVAESLRRFQLAYKLPVTGVVDQLTLEKMNLKRCGNADVIGANSVGQGRINEGVSSHKVLKRSVENFKGKKRKATRMIEEKRRKRALATIQEKPVFKEESKPSSFLSRLLFPKTKPRLSQSAERRLQMIREYQKQYAEEDQTNPRDPKSKQRRGSLISSRRSEAVVPDVATTRRRRKRSATQYLEGIQRFSLERTDCIRWRILNTGYSQRLTIYDQRSIFNMAFRMWAEVTPLCFLEDYDSEAEDLDIPIAFGDYGHQACPVTFDGPSGALAHNMPQGDIHLDDSEPWKLDKGEDGVNLLKIAVHEIGHGLGLSHIGRNNSVMFAIYTGIPQYEDFEVGWEDRKEVQSIYGVCAGRFDVIFDWVQINKDTLSPFYNSYFFRNDKYWMYENRYNRTRYGDPLFVLSEWSGVPANVDSYVQIIYTYHFHEGDTILEIHTMFFSGDYVYFYDDEFDRVKENGTLLIKDAFAAVSNLTSVYPPADYPHAVAEDIPSNLDAVIWSYWDERLVFFKDEWVYVLNPVVGKCCEEKMLFRDKFPGIDLDGYLDTAFYAHYQSALYLFKEDNVYEAVGFGYYVDSATTPLPRHNNTHISYVDKWFNIWYDICEVSATSEYTIESDAEDDETEAVAADGQVNETTKSTNGSAGASNSTAAAT